VRTKLGPQTQQTAAPKASWEVMKYRQVRFGVIYKSRSEGSVMSASESIPPPDPIHTYDAVFVIFVQREVKRNAVHHM
jgi:hypothetical protein